MAAIQVDGRVAQRQDSIRSVESEASSVTSGVSLNRRPRTRIRSRTVTGTPAPPNKTSVADQAPDLPLLDRPYVRESIEPPTEDSSILQNTVASAAFDSEMTGQGTGTRASEVRDSNLETVQVGVGSMLSNLKNPSSVTVKSSKTSGLPIHPTASEPHPPPSAFSRHPELTRIDASGSRIRDSMGTQFSGTSSSVYPLSTTTTTSEPETPLSPVSIHDSEPSGHSYEPEIVEPPGFDADDVSYRLQLLMKNNFYLPPAHAKPNLADLAAANPNANRKATRPAAPTFLDLFRGKGKSRSSQSGGPPQRPTLRTTSDSISSVRAEKPRLSSPVPRTTSNPTPRSGRVVVVREKMEDLALAAKQAEKDLKARTLRHDQESIKEAKSNGVIDPTDAVDVPPPSSTYPFAVQASAMHGLGVQDSVGAALLADRLPPRSPEPSSKNVVNDWRKVLLHQAVHHSLDNLNSSVDFSFSNAGASSTPLASPRAVASPRVSSPTSPSSAAPPLPTPPTPAPPHPIFAQPILTDFGVSETSAPPSLKGRKSTISIDSAMARALNNSGMESLRQSILPARAESPHEPLAPLTPPPRKFLVNTMPPTPTSPHAPPGSHVTQNDGQRPPPPPSPLRKAASSPRLSASYEHRQESLHPPSQHPEGSPSFEDMQDARSHLTESRISFNESHQGNSRGRVSMVLSAFGGAESRASLSEYSQPSPTSSAFQSAPLPNDSEEYLRSVRDPDHTFTSFDHSHPRQSTTSPPPRISSSFGFAPLSPAPRRPAFQPNKSLKPQPSGSSQFSVPQRQATPLADDTTLLIMAPEPTSPPLPPTAELESRAPAPLSLEIPTSSLSGGLHSPVPASPTSFFDDIQSQPNAMDELESSSSESEDEMDEDYPQPLPPPFQPYADKRTRAMSNASSSASLYSRGRAPNGSQTNLQTRSASPASISSKRAVGNVPVRAPFFTERANRSDIEHGPPTSTLDFYKYSQQNRPATADVVENHSSSATAARRRSTVSATVAWSPHEKDDHLKKLDGMLKEHVEAEKDRIRRIAHSAQSNASVHTQGN